MKTNIIYSASPVNMANDIHYWVYNNLHVEVISISTVARPEGFITTITYQ